MIVCAARVRFLFLLVRNSYINKLLYNNIIIVFIGKLRNGNLIQATDCLYVGYSWLAV
jgi:hypothetical protein